MRFAKFTRKRIYAAAPGSLEVRWPKGEPEIGHRYAIEKAEAKKRGKAEDQVVVLACRESKVGWYATVRLHGDPVNLLGKAGGYVESSLGAIGSSKKINPGDLREEPEAIHAQDQRRITERASEAEVMRLRQHWVEKRAQIERAIAELRDIGLDDRELWIMERRMEKLDEKLANAAA